MNVLSLTRAASRAGTRSVSTLTADQLARKRANDREAQRLIRQRTKEHIEQLETRVRELSQRQEESGELEEVWKRNLQLEHELKQLRETTARLARTINSPALLQSSRSTFYALHRRIYTRFLSSV